MPYTVERRGRCVYWTFNEPVGMEKLLTIYNGLYGSAQFDETRAQVRDFSAFKVTPPISVEDIQRIAANDLAAAKSNVNMKIAIILPANNPNLQTMAQLFLVEMRDGPWRVKVFENKAEAEAWATQAG